MSPKQRAILVGAVVTGILSTSYLAVVNACCCLGVMIGGAATTQQLVSQTDGPVEAGDGAFLGAGAGALGVVISHVFDRILRPFGLDSQSISEGFQQQMLEQMQQSSGSVPEWYEQMLQSSASGEVGWGFFLFQILVGMIVYAIFGAIGGAIGTSIFGRQE